MTRAETIELTIKSLLEVVQTGAKNIEIAIMAPGKTVEMLPSEDIEKIVEKINSDKDAAAEANSGRRGARGGASGSEQVLASRPAGEAPPE